jgi:ATP-dependent RNA helicase DeaD
MKQIERMLGKTIAYKTIPTGREICEKQLFNLIDKVENVEVNTELIEEYLKVIYKKLEWLDRDDLIRHFVSVEFNRFLASYENARDLNIGTNSGPADRKQSFNGRERNGNETGKASAGDMRKGRGTWSGSRKGVSFSRFFLNLGKNDQVDKRSIIDMINRQMPGKSVEIGEIEVLRNFSFFEVDNRYEKDVYKAFGKASFNGKRIGLETARPRSN